jgi:regulatory protein
MDRIITALKVQKRNSNRINVYIDGEFAFGLARIVAAWLRVGQALSDEKISELKAQDARETAYQNALRLLSVRDRSEAEIIERLRKKQVPEDVIPQVMERLHRSKLVDDEHFAQTWIENRTVFRPRSQRLLAYELREKGIDPTAIQEALASFDEHEAAEAAARKHAQKLQHLERREFRQKLYGFLARRGFHHETIIEVINQIWSENNHDDAPEITPRDEEVDL